MPRRRAGPIPTWWTTWRLPASEPPSVRAHRAPRRRRRRRNNRRRHTPPSGHAASALGLLTRRTCIVHGESILQTEQVLVRHAARASAQCYRDLVRAIAASTVPYRPGTHAGRPAKATCVAACDRRGIDPNNISPRPRPSPTSCANRTAVRIARRPFPAGSAFWELPCRDQIPGVGWLGFKHVMATPRWTTVPFQSAADAVRSSCAPRKSLQRVSIVGTRGCADAV